LRQGRSASTPSSAPRPAGALETQICTTPETESAEKVTDRRRPSRRSVELQNEARKSEDADVLSFLAFAAGANVELDAIALVERLVAIALDVGVVDEDVVALLARDEAEALLRVEELHGTCGQNLLSSFKDRPLRPVPHQRSLRDGPAESPGQRLCPVYDDLVRRCPDPHGRADGAGHQGDEHDGTRSGHARPASGSPPLRRVERLHRRMTRRHQQHNTRPQPSTRATR
jgi:hypothetical protein